MGFDSPAAKRRRIAFLTVDWNYELVEHTLHGLKKYTEDHPDVAVRVFDCFGKDLGNDKDKSEYAVFSLPDFSEFDGVMIQGNQIVLRSARDRVVRAVNAAGIPAVTIGCRLEGCTLVAFDNERAQYEMTEHVIRKHHAQRLVYLTGIMDNDCPEGAQRLDGFLAACRDNRIPEENIEVIRCTWRTSDGVNVGRMWARKKYPLPDAFVCANDEMALGLMSALQEHGLKIPDDVIITGFDNLTSAQLSSPRLTSVHTDHEKLNYFAMDVLMNIIDGTEKREAVSFGFELICSESCGCESSPRHDLIRDLYFQQTRFLRNFYLQQDQMAEDLFGAADLRELMQIIGKNHSIFGCDNIYLCINDFYFDNYDKNLWECDSESFGEQMVLASCGKCAGEDPDDSFVRFPTSLLLPEELRQKEPFLIFYPLHYNTYSIGYLALNGISSAAKLNLHESIITFLEIAIENVRKKSLLHSMNDILDDLYVHDALTGLFNRFGFSRYGQETYERLILQEGSAQILFTDLDDMKGINDRYGHEIGDAALKAAARILQKTCGRNAFIMRYGGDEFIIIDSGRNKQLAEDIQGAADRYNRESGMPYTLSFSIGVVWTDAEESRPVEECVQAADGMMYEIKNKKKSQSLRMDVSP